MYVVITIRKITIIFKSSGRLYSGVLRFTFTSCLAEALLCIGILKAEVDVNLGGLSVHVKCYYSN